MALLVTAVERTTKKPDIAASTPVSSATCLTQGGLSVGFCRPASMRALTLVTNDLRPGFFAIDTPPFVPADTRMQALVAGGFSQAVKVGPLACRTT